MRRPSFRRLLAALFSGLLLLSSAGSTRADEAPAPAAAAKADAENQSDTWQAVYLNGQRIGFNHLKTEELQRDGKTITVSDILSQMTITRFGVSLHMSVSMSFEEDADGNLLAFRTAIENPPISNVKSHGKIANGKVTVTTLNSGKEITTEEKWDPAAKSQAWISKMIEKDLVKDGDSRSFKMYDPQFSQVATLTVTRVGPTETELLNGEVRTLDKYEATHSLVPGLVTTTYVDAEGETLKEEASLLEMVTYTVSKEEAEKELTGADLDFGMDTIIKTGKIPGAHKARKGVYKVTVSGSAKSALPDGPTQKVVPLSDTELELTVTSIKPGDSGDEPAPAPSFLASSRFLDTADENVVALAREGAGSETDPAKLAVTLEKFVHDRLKNKNFSTALATASEVAKELSGDCTEHAVLLAALLRVNGVPSRVVIGFVYADTLKGFGGHMWTEAYVNGRWVPLDATLGLGGIGVGHIKVADADLAENTTAPLTAFVPIIHLLKKTAVNVVKIE